MAQEDDYRTLEDLLIDWQEDGEPNQPLYITDLNIYTLPDLPIGLRELHLRNLPNLSILPKLPDTLRILHVSNAPLSFLFLNEGILDVELITVFITSISYLPSSLVDFRYMKGPLSRICELPKNLYSLVLEDLYLDKLPQLPQNLTIFSIDGTMIKKLPPLPPRLVYLDISNTDIEKYPADVPDTVENIFITGSRISSINRLPKNIKSLDIHDSPFEFLPDLHEGLEEIYIKGTLISSIPKLPSTLKVLSAYCLRTLTSLPPLPQDLKEIYVHDTSIVLLHDIPETVVEFQCHNCPNLLIAPDQDDDAVKYRARWDNYFKDNAMKLCKTIKEELMMRMYHPDRISCLIEKYGIDILD